MAKIGDGHAAGMARLGLAELRQAVSFGHGSVEQPTGPGIFGAPTQGEIAKAREGPGSGLEQEQPQTANSNAQGTLSMADLKAHAAARSEAAAHRMDQQHDNQHQRGGNER